MAATNNKHLAYRYGYCVNEKCEKSKKDTKGKPQVLQIASHKPLVCPDCQKPLHECPPPKPPTNILKWILIGLLVLLLLGGAGFGIYKLLKPIGPKAIKLAQKELVMKVGETQVIVPTAEPEGVKATFIFKKKGKNIEVTSGGEVTALKKGEATILVKCEENPDIRALCKIKVENGEEAVVVEPTQDDTEAKEPETPAEEEPKAEEKTEDPKQKTTTTEKSKSTETQNGMGTKVYSYGKYAGNLKNGQPDGTGKLTFTQPYQLNAQYTAQPGEYIQGVFENGKPTFVTYYQKDGTVTKIKLR